MVEKEITAKNLLEAIENTNKNVSNLSQAFSKNLESKPKDIEPKKEDHKVETALEHISHCPDCYKDIYKKYDNAEFECADCGLPFAYPKEEIDKSDFNCPNCKGGKYIEREETEEVEE